MPKITTTIKTSYESNKLLATIDILPNLNGHLENLQEIIKIHGKEIHDIIVSEYLEGRLQIDQLKEGKHNNHKNRIISKGNGRFFNDTYSLMIKPTIAGEIYYSNLRLALGCKEVVLEMIRKNQHKTSKNGS